MLHGLARWWTSRSPVVVVVDDSWDKMEDSRRQEMAP